MPQEVQEGGCLQCPAEPLKVALWGMTEIVMGSTACAELFPTPNLGLCPRTCVGQQGLQGGPNTLVGQQLFRGLVPQEHTQHSLGFVAMPRVGVPCDTETQQGLCG